MGISLVLRSLSFLSLFSHASAQKGNYPLMYGDGSVLKGATQACIDTFNSNVTCTQAIGSLYADPYPKFKETTLDGLCTAVCFKSLVSLRSALVSNCGTSVTYLDVADGSHWPITYLADLAIFNYNMTCLPRSDGQYCNSWFQTGVDATPEPDCDECYLKTAYMQAESSIKGDTEGMKEIYASMTSNCGYDGPPATKTASAVVISSPTATSDCSSTYTIKPGDTAIGVSVSQRVTTQDLITANGLSYTLEKFPASGTLCIRNQCKIHTIRSDDTCHSILVSEGISQAKLLSWNPFINGHCDNIADFVDQTLCLSNPLGDYSVEDNKDSGFYTEPAAVPANIAPDTTTNCGAYYNTTIGDDCGTVTMKFSISLDDFIFLNPMIWQNCTNLWSDTSYCASPVGRISDYPGYGNPEPVFSITPDVTKSREYFNPFEEDEGSIYIPLAKDTRNDCWDYIWWNASLGLPITCWELADQSGITREQFILWNPSLDQNIDDADATKSYEYDCTIAPSVSYCSALASPTPMVAATIVPASPRAVGEIESCTKWFRSALSCESHLSMLRISLADFYRFNPSIGADCSSYVLGTYYCYSTNDDGSPPTDPSTTNISPTPSATDNASATPKPIQDGMVSGCTSFYPVVSGDGCWAIANDNGISLDDLYAWNPALNGDCSGLFPTYYLCISRNPTSTSAPGATSTRPVTPSTTTRAQVSSTVSRTSTAGPVATPSSPPISGDATCGGAGGNTCIGSTFGNCCSSNGWCGDTAAYCGSGCQGAFGICNTAPEKISPDGSCGGSTGGYTCTGSEFGPCCSEYGWCGSTEDHCTNCQVGFGC